MWKQTDSEQPSGTRRATVHPDAASRLSKPREPTQLAAPCATIGPSVIIKGELTGSENLTVDGQVEGTIHLREHALTVGPRGTVTAAITADSVTVCGQVTGNITATQKIEIRENGSVEGDIAAPRVAIADGAHFRGRIDMQGATRPVQTAPPKTVARQTPVPSGLPTLGAVPGTSGVPTVRASPGTAAPARR